MIEHIEMCYEYAYPHGPHEMMYFESGGELIDAQCPGKEPETPLARLADVLCDLIVTSNSECSYHLDDDGALVFELKVPDARNLTEADLGDMLQSARTLKLSSDEIS